MVEWVAPLLGVGLAALSFLLTSIAWLAARRFGELRFYLIGVTFLTFGIVGTLSAMSEYFDLFDEQFAVEPAPLVLLVFALGILYVAFLRGRTPSENPGHG